MTTPADAIPDAMLFGNRFAPKKCQVTNSQRTA